MNPTLGSYTIKAKIADGGMGEVFKAIKRGTFGFEKTVVIKKLLPFYADNTNFVKMLISEAKISSNLNHPNVVQTIDFLEARGNFYLVMEYVDGVDLGRIIQKSKTLGRSVDPNSSLYIISEVLKGLKYAHSLEKDGTHLKIIHRDISPQNILISYAGVVKLTDFGVAWSVLSEAKTKTGDLKGKVNYMAPEQIKRQSLDERTDIFAASVLLYELLYARRPFEGSTEFETMKNIADLNTLPDLTPIPGLKPGITKILGKGLSRNREARYTSTGYFLKDILDIIPDETLKTGNLKLKKLLDELISPDERKPPPIVKTPVLQVEDRPHKLSEKSLLSGKIKPITGISSGSSRQILYIAAGILILLAAAFVVYPAFKTNEEPKEEIIREKIDVKNGFLSINSHPWSTVYINGKEFGETPLKVIELKAGQYLLNMVFPDGRNIIKRVRVKENDHTVIFEKPPEK